MMKILTAAAALSLAMAGTAPAMDVGAIMQIRQYQPAPACNLLSDASRVASFLFSDRWVDAANFAEWNALREVRPGEYRGCIILNTSPDAQWRVIDKRPYSSGRAYFCVESTIDYGGPASAGYPRCFWIALRDK